MSGDGGFSVVGQYHIRASPANHHGSSVEIACDDVWKA
jgi:hypothetical protein